MKTLTYWTNFGECRKLHQAKDGLFSIHENMSHGCYFVRGEAVILIKLDGQHLEVGQLSKP